MAIVRDCLIEVPFGATKPLVSPGQARNSFAREDIKVNPLTDIGPVFRHSQLK